MNQIVHKLLLAGDKFKPEMHLRKPGFTYSVCGPFTKNKERIQKFTETGDSLYIYWNELGKVCFQHSMAYGHLQKPTIRKFEKRKVHSPFTDNILGADLADMQLISKINKVIHCLLCYWYFQ